ncbi:hypothetical protein [Lentzea jiangxiensis]|uniref:Peptidase inhibitor family I36 n=1 Tax=Lentzea jiangxiensis TaxID=641025 RepID=A0A1H0SKI6_9PSEU|nr:hypothetical protein [Lentzea jiangxiensis]SDP42342.1 hypothetical protein SAMN05421507_108129 [Lentzea jiangxiensis]
MKKRVLAAFAALGMALVVAPVTAQASAPASSPTACEPGVACFYDSVRANTVPKKYGNPSTTCTALPFVAKALINATERRIALYEDTACTQLVLVEPANNFHSYPSHEVRAFRAL